MSEEQLKAFLEKVKSNTELQEKLKAATSPEAGLEIAKKAGFSITSEDIQSMQSATVSDEELEGAAGGQNTNPYVCETGPVRCADSARSRC
jgi:predicted ribosomally synthesized peptide with nif11-like leader